MPAAEVAARVRESLASLKSSDFKDAQVMEVLKLAQQLTDTMQLFFGSLDRSIHEEFTYIANYISKTREEISRLRPNDIKEQRIPVAGAELEAVVSDTEKATEAIQRITDGGTSQAAQLGFPALKFYGGGKSADIVLEGGIGSAMPSDITYFIDTDCLHFRYHKDRNFSKFGGKQTPVNQDAVVQHIGFYGELTMVNPIHMAKLFDSSV